MLLSPLLSVRFSLGSAVGVVPNGPLHNVEKGVGVGLEDAHSNFVTHTTIIQVRNDW